jgi:signal transduction histidine kinase
MSLLFRDKQVKYDYRQVFLDFNRSLHTIKEKTLLISSIATRIYELVPARSAYLFWENSDATRYVPINVSENHADLYLLPEDGLTRWMQLNEKPLTVSFAPEFANIYSAHDASVIRQLESVLICPLKTNNYFRGILFLGDRIDGATYKGQDLEMLTVLLDNAALAIENIIYYEERANHLKHIIQTDRLAVIGQLAAGAAHEIRNPLTSIRSAIQYVQKDIENPRKQLIIQSALTEVDRINGILTGLLSFSRQNNPVKREFDLASMMDQTVELLKNTRIRKEITYTVTYFTPCLPLIADSDQLKQVFMNIILNAIDAIDEEGHIRISVQPAHFSGELYYVITIVDNGKGIDEENLEKLFDPFYTTKEDGTGLGLSISYGIIHRHKGNIDISNHPDGGTQVVISLPQGEEIKE